MWDGIENAGWRKHDDNILTWKNLGSLGSDYDATRQSGAWQKDGAIISTDMGNSTVFVIPNNIMGGQMKGEWTYEIGFTPTHKWKSNYHGLLGNHINQKGIVGGQYENGEIVFNLFSPVVQLYRVRADVFEDNIRHTISQAASNTSRTATTWKDGAIVSLSTDVDVLLTITSPYAFIGSAEGDRVAGTDRVFDGVIHFLRIYNRKLTDKEEKHNHSIDKIRYGLPS